MAAIVTLVGVAFLIQITGDHGCLVVPGSVEDFVATLWSVQGKAAREFMVLFYSKLFKSGAAEALRQTAIEVRNQSAPISRWASFVMVGDGRLWTKS